MSDIPSSEQLESWIESYLNGTISEDDKKALEYWYNFIPDREINWSNPGLDSPKALQLRLLGAIDAKIDNNKRERNKRRLRRVTRVAAVLIFIIGAVSTIWHYKVSKKNNSVAALHSNDIQPGTTLATLTLSNGKKIVLDSAHSVNINIVKGEVCLTDKAGQKMYVNKDPQLSVLNTLLTHKGEQAPPVTLADGTKVWLNAASKLYFPLAFAGKTREVFLSGEAYFEVAKDHSHPFVVNIGTNKIEVLGTHFDVMAYNEEPCAYTTLLEGSVRISSSNGNAMLTPGQQGEINSNGAIHIKTVDVEQSVAWLHGQLPMDGTDILAFMRAVSRWYNVDIVYSGKPPVLNFSGSLDKQTPLPQLLNALNANGIHCELKDRKIILYGK